MPPPVQDKDRIYFLACECEELFSERVSEERSSITSSLLIEYQQRFATWTAYLGVFARPSQCLDRRLKSLLDIRDIVLRLLALLKRALSLFSHPDTTAADDVQIKNQDAQASSNPEIQSLEEIEETLDRLNRLGVAIRQSARVNVDHRVELFAQNLDMKDFEHVFTNMVQILYPNTHPSLRGRLTKSMTNRLAKVAFLQHRQRALTTRRDEQPQHLMDIPENDAVQEMAPTTIVQHHPTSSESQLQSIQPIVARFSFSDISSLDTALFRSKLNNIWRPSPKTRKTSFTQIKYDNYPQPPKRPGVEAVICEWCAQPLGREDLDPATWRQHVDQDLKPYICLSEECAESSAGFSAFEDWSDHMQTHGHRWHQDVYLMPCWICAVCEVDQDVFGDPESLLAHMQEMHIDQFTAEQIQTISRRSRISKPRPLNECPLCCFRIQNEDPKNKAASQKRGGEPPERKSYKSARTSIHESHPKLQADTDEFTIESNSKLAKVMTQHIASHLQALMSLTIRIASRQAASPTAVDVESDVVDNDGAFSSSRDEDLPPLSSVNDEMNVEEPESPTLPPSQPVANRSLADDSPLQDIPPESDDFGKWGEILRHGEISTELQLPVVDLLVADTQNNNDNDPQTLATEPDIDEDRFVGVSSGMGTILVPSIDPPDPISSHYSDGLDELWAKLEVEDFNHKKMRGAMNNSFYEGENFIDDIFPDAAGFEFHITTINPNLGHTNTSLLKRLKDKQLQRHRRLVTTRISHFGLGSNCLSGYYCYASGGTPSMHSTKTFVTLYGPPGFPPGVPAPPSLSLPATFECPLCYRVKRFQQISDWIHHLHEDLRSYTCIWPDCQVEESFQSKADWARHESEAHCHQVRWICDYPSCSSTSYTQEGFLAHWINSHGFKGPKDVRGPWGFDDLDSKANECRKTRRPDEEPCKFCNKAFPEWSLLIDHIAGHLEEISLSILRIVALQYDMFPGWHPNPIRL